MPHHTLPLATVLALALAACGQNPQPSPEATAPDTPTAPASSTPSDPSPTATTASSRQLPAPTIGRAVALREWARADNRAGCAPLALASDGGQPALARRANFSGGWGVAFDLHEQRSAYGFAGTGVLPETSAIDEAGLSNQWPSFRKYAAGEALLPPGSYAGYGLMGAKPYSDANPQGLGEHSVAYLRVAGQDCLYNVWSQVSRAHLETLLENLAVVGP